MDIKGIKMNGEILKEFSTGGGVLYRTEIDLGRGYILITYGSNETPLYIISEEDMFSTNSGFTYGILFSEEAPPVFCKMYTTYNEIPIYRRSYFVLHIQYYDVENKEYKDINCYDEFGTSTISYLTQVPIPFTKK